ncbi:MAG TPA: hypothetical protein VMJ30_07190 [Gemmatimonadales bacterium]|nr:hypothetical protein [Gemmatimonadales bacterium]
MSGLQLLLAWSAVVVWFLVWRLAGVRTAGASPIPIRRAWLPLGTEALLLVLFAALWFGSLGHGGWALLFLVTGLLIELPPRLRAHAADAGRHPISWPNLTGALVRLLGAGALLTWLL